MRVLKERHLLLFRLGFCCDATGTTLMSRSTSGPFIFSLHGVTGLLAIPLMLFHAVWGTGVHAGRNPEPKARFHRLSVAVWAVWLVPYLSGLVFGMRGSFT